MKQCMEIMNLIDNMIDQVEDRCAPNLQEIFFSFFDRGVLEKERDGRMRWDKLAQKHLQCDPNFERGPVEVPICSKE
jgi:hypothetical protein